MQLRLTGDGSHTLYVPSLDEHYHSTFGAVTESEHIFIRAGLASLPAEMEEVSIFEVGFGTGLNALMACLYARQNSLAVRYASLEKYPLPEGMAEKFNFPSEMTAHLKAPLNLKPQQISDLFLSLHRCPWNAWREITPLFQLLKIHGDLLEFQPEASRHDLVFFDAFGPDVQPEMWSEEIFQKIAGSLKNGGVLVTYSTKGTVKRNLKAAGFAIQKLPGPPGKREILRARLL